MEKEKKGKVEPKVTVFGNDVGDNISEEKTDRFHFYQSRQFKCDGGRGNFVWGFFLILAGVIFLFNTLGVLPWSVWSLVGRIWPVLIILIGIDVLFGRSWISRFLSFILTLFVFATTLGVILTKVSPDLLSGMPTDITTFLTNVSQYLQIK